VPPNNPGTKQVTIRLRVSGGLSFQIVHVYLFAQQPEIIRQSQTDVSVHVFKQLNGLRGSQITNSDNAPFNEGSQNKARNLEAFVVCCADDARISCQVLQYSPGCSPR